MNAREQQLTFNKIKRIRDKANKLTKEAKALDSEGQKILNLLAKSHCPYKEDQMFKKRGSQIWVKFLNPSPHNIKYGVPNVSYMEAPYSLECLRCTVKGVVDKGNWVFIAAEDIGIKWDIYEK